MEYAKINFKLKLSPHDVFPQKESGAAWELLGAMSTLRRLHT
jgi:hypothetical protein